MNSPLEILQTKWPLMACVGNCLLPSNHKGNICRCGRPAGIGEIRDNVDDWEEFLKKNADYEDTLNIPYKDSWTNREFIKLIEKYDTSTNL